MNIQMDATPSDLPNILTKFISLIGMDKLKHRLDVLEKRSKDIGWKDFNDDRLPLETALLNVIKYKKATGRIQWPCPPDQYRLFSFMFAVVSIHQHLSIRGKERLARSLSGYLNQEDGFGSIAFEMRVASSLMKAGFDVSFSDIEGDERFDFLVSKDEEVFEVECKYVSPDIGRKIHQKKFHQFAEFIKPSLDEIMKTLTNGIFIKVQIADRLHVKVEEIEPIKKAIDLLMKEGKETHTPSFSIEKVNFEISESPIKDGKTTNLAYQLKAFTEQKLGISNSHIMLRAELRNNVAVILSIHSLEADAVLDGIYKKHLRAACEQFSGSKPGIAFLHFSGIDEDQLHEVASTRSGLANKINQILQKRDKLYGVAVMTNGTVEETHGNDLYAPTITSETGSVYGFKNPFFNLELKAGDLFSKIFNYD